MKIVILVATLALSATSSAQSASECIPKLKDCNKPVRWIADKQDCSCYACEYGKPTQHTGCTKDNQLKAQLKDLQKESEEAAYDAAPLKVLRGTIKAVGDKVTFVDKDGKSWEIMNPEELKSHEGHQVIVRAHVYADKDAIQVTSLKATAGGKTDESKE